MHFYEFEAKKILSKHGIPIPKGGTAKTPAEAKALAAELGIPVMVKAQVFSRWRHKAGAVKVAKTPAEAAEAAEALLALEFKSETPPCVLVEQQLQAKKLLCVHVTYDGTRRLPLLSLTEAGGADLDDTLAKDPGAVKQRHFSALTPMTGYQAKEVVKKLGYGGRDLVRLTGVASRLAEIFLRYDFTFSEINALAQLEDGSFVALDGHVDLEVEARPRQQALLDELGIKDADSRGARKPTPFEVEGAAIDAEDPRGIIGPVVEFDGDIGLVIGAGGGSISTFDAIKRWGGKPANYVAIGGNPSVKKAERLTKLVLSKPGVEKICVISNVVSNTRADLVARGVIKGVLALGFEPKDKITIFRVPGAWEADAFKILDKYGIEYCDRTVSLSEAARRAVEKAKA